MFSSAAVAAILWGVAGDSWSTPDGQRADRPIHIYPLNDLRDHDTTDALCPCMPRVIDPEPHPDDDDPTFPCRTIIRHNSYDGREFGNVIRVALDSLGVALADHHHQWSSALRDSYDH